MLLTDALKLVTFQDVNNVVRVDAKLADVNPEGKFYESNFSYSKEQLTKEKLRLIAFRTHNRIQKYFYYQD